jgi:hypothetical protein
MCRGAACLRLARECDRDGGKHQHHADRRKARRAAMFGGAALPSRPQIEARVRACAALFLRGCQVK